MNLKAGLSLVALVSIFIATFGVSAKDEQVSDLIDIYKAEVKALRDENLAEELARMQRIDQLVRKAFFDILNKEELTPKSKGLIQIQANDVILNTDALNTERLKTILKTYNWQQLAATRTDAANNAYSIVQHSGDLAFMESALPHFEQFARSGLVGGSSYAKMFDRVAMMTGKPQRFGTQARCLGGKLSIHEIEEEQKLDERRAEFGLEAYETFKKRLLKMYRNSC